MSGKPVLRWEVKIRNGPSTVYTFTAWGQTEQSAKNNLKRDHKHKPWVRLIDTAEITENPYT